MKILIGTDTFHKEGSPHLMATSVDYDSSSDKGIHDREDVYKDVIGFYREIPDEFELDDLAITEMDEWANTLKKNIIFLVKGDKKLKGWLFEYSKEVSYRKVQVYTLNDINYDIWLDPETNFWNPVDFLLEAEYFTPDEELENERLKNIEKNIEQINTNISKLINRKE